MGRKPSKPPEPEKEPVLSNEEKVPPGKIIIYCPQCHHRLASIGRELIENKAAVNIKCVICGKTVTSNGKKETIGKSVDKALLELYKRYEIEKPVSHNSQEED